MSWMGLSHIELQIAYHTSSLMDRVLSTVLERLEVQKIADAYTLAANILLVAQSTGVAFAKADDQHFHRELICNLRSVF